MQFLVPSSWFTPTPDSSNSYYRVLRCDLLGIDEVTLPETYAIPAYAQITVKASTVFRPAILSTHVQPQISKSYITYRFLGFTNKLVQTVMYESDLLVLNQLKDDPGSFARTFVTIRKLRKGANKKSRRNECT